MTIAARGARVEINAVAVIELHEVDARLIHEALGYDVTKHVEGCHGSDQHRREIVRAFGNLRDALWDGCKKIDEAKTAALGKKEVVP